MIKTTCCTFIPNNTAPDGSVARVLAGLQSLRLELAESSGINDPFTGWMESPMSDGRYRCSRCHPSLHGDRVYTGEFGRGTTRGARPDLAGEHRMDLLHHCPRAPTPCSAPIHEDPLTPLPPFSHPSHCKRTPPPTTEVISDPNPLAVTLTLTSPYTHTITSEPGPKDCLWPEER